MTVNYRFNPVMKEYMKELFKVNTENSKNIDTYFNEFQDWLKPINKNHNKTQNYYKADKCGVVIRKKDFQKINSPFGWIFNDVGLPVSIHSNYSIPEEEIFSDTINGIKQKFIKSISNEKDILYRIYKIHPEKVI